jgi:hypothetical protein
MLVEVTLALFEMSNQALLLAINPTFNALVWSCSIQPRFVGHDSASVLPETLK